MKLTENDLRLLIRGILSEQVEETAEEEVEDSEGTEESGGDDESKIIELIASGNGQYARELVLTLQLNLNRSFFSKLIDYGVNLLQASFSPKLMRGGMHSKTDTYGFYAVALETPEMKEAFRRWESFSKGVGDFLMHNRFSFAGQFFRTAPGSHADGGFTFDPMSDQQLSDELALMNYYWEQIKSADDKPISESVSRRWQLLAGIKE